MNTHIVCTSVLMCQMLKRFHNPVATLRFAEGESKLSLKPNTALQHDLWCQVLHINDTTDNICGSPRTEVRGADTK